MSIKKYSLNLLLGVAVVATAYASDFDRLDRAIQTDSLGEEISRVRPVFDFDGDGCLPSAGISRDGVKNAGLATTGRITGDCRSSDFFDTSNTLHRHACVISGGAKYCGHFYALYFEKDQLFDFFGGGHRHDWEYAAIWTKNGVVTHGSASAHGDLFTRAVADLPMQAGHMKIVYHKDGITTHAMRFAKDNEAAENPYSIFLTPEITSWYVLYGDGISNQQMRNKLNTFDYGSGSIPMKDSNFRTNLNRFKPSNYPTFTQASIEAANPN